MFISVKDAKKSTLYQYIEDFMEFGYFWYSWDFSVASFMWLVRKSTKMEPGHVDGAINCPVGLTHKGPASLQMVKRNLNRSDSGSSVWINRRDSMISFSVRTIQWQSRNSINFAAKTSDSVSVVLNSRA